MNPIRPTRLNNKPYINSWSIYVLSPPNNHETDPYQGRLLFAATPNSTQTPCKYQVTRPPRFSSSVHEFACPTKSVPQDGGGNLVEVHFFSLLTRSSTPSLRNTVTPNHYCREQQRPVMSRALLFVSGFVAIFKPDEAKDIMNLYPSGSRNRTARVPDGVSAGSESRVPPCFLIRFAISSML